ncbi:hypothetical protein ACLB2K_023170 [Fragaria x ananassa]
MDFISGPQKLIVVMGATGSGKSRLSLDLAARFPPATFEVINADKMQLYKGLDVTTNKLFDAERRVVPHHLLGEFDSRHGDVSPAEFRRLAAQAVSDAVLSGGKVLVLVGGSNSFIHALLVERFEPDVDVFDGEIAASSQLRYDCCFLWADVAFPVLMAYLSRRVEEMLDAGMFQELAEFHGQNRAVQTGVSKAIGVAEFSRYFEEYAAAEVEEDDPVRRGAYEEAVGEVKRNTSAAGEEADGEDCEAEEGGVGPEEAGRDGGVQGGGDVR